MNRKDSRAASSSRDDKNGPPLSTASRSKSKHGIHAREGGGSDRVIRYKTFLHNAIGDVLKARGWVEVKDDNDWDFYWCDVSWMREHFDH